MSDGIKFSAQLRALPGSRPVPGCKCLVCAVIRKLPHYIKIRAYSNRKKPLIGPPVGEGTVGSNRRSAPLYPTATSG